MKEQGIRAVLEAAEARQEGKTVEGRLRDLAALHGDRRALYGDNYMHVGRIMMGMFPSGLELRNEEDFNRLHLFFHLVGKLTRYARQMPGGGHEDSLDDIAVYAMLLRQFDYLVAGNGD